MEILNRITSYNVCYTKLLRAKAGRRQNQRRNHQATANAGGSHWVSHLSVTD